MDEALTTVAVEQVEPAGDEQQNTAVTLDQVAENQDFDLENQEGDETGEGEEPQLVDIEINGKTYKLHPDLKDRVWFDTDYTQKSQANAELKKSLEARQVEIDQAYNISQEALQARAAIINIDGALKQYENVDWNRLEAEDPLAAQSHWRQFQQLQQQRGQVAQYLDKTQADLSEKANQAVEARLRETKEFAQKELKGWTPEMDAKITDFATKELGFTVEDLRAQYTPQVYRTMYLAYLGQQTLSKMNQAKPKPSIQQPLETVQAKASPAIRVSPEKMSMDDFASWINKR